jgi:hypothetical protein
MRHEELPKGLYKTKITIRAQEKNSVTLLLMWTLQKRCSNLLDINMDVRATARTEVPLLREISKGCKWKSCIWQNCSPLVLEKSKDQIPKKHWSTACAMNVLALKADGTFI